jgi:hypothetical protein
MAVEDLIEIFPLVRGDLIDHRYELHELIVKKILFKKEKYDRISLENLKREIIEDFNFEDFPDELLVKILEDLTKGEFLKRTAQGEYELLKKPGQESISPLLDNCYRKFAEVLKTEVKDFDLYLNKNFKDAFIKCMWQIVHIFSEQQEVNEIQIDVLNQDETKAHFEQIVKSEGIEPQQKFLSPFFKYIGSGENNITDFIFHAYRGAIAYDLLKRGKILTRETCNIGDGGLLILDTNTIISLMCKTDTTHSLAKSAIELSRKIGFDVCYTHLTASEYHGLLQAADHIMKSSRFKPSNPTDNQLILDFLKRDDRNWSDYHTEMSNYKNFIKIKYDIDYLGVLDINPNKEVMEYIEQIYPVMLQTMGKERESKALNHDLYLFKLLTHFRNTEQPRAFDSPWILSFDNALNVINQFVVDRFKRPYGYSIHPRYWLNTLLVFSNVEFDDKRREDIVKALMEHMIFPQSALTLEQYATLVTYELGLNQEDIDTILSIVTISPLKYTLEKALMENKGEEASKISMEILTDSDLIDKAILERKTKQELVKTRELLINVAAKYREEQAKVHALERVRTAPVVIVAGVDAGVSQMIAALLMQIEALDPDFYEKTKINKLEAGEASKDEVIGFVEKVKDALHQGTEFAKDLEVLKLITSTILTSLGAST